MSTRNKLIIIINNNKNQPHSPHSHHFPHSIPRFPIPALYSVNYENIILIGNFNVIPEGSHMETFCKSYELKDVIKFLLDIRTQKYLM